MAFEPFGLPFEVTTFDAPSEVKAKIRRTMVRWYHPSRGARGWVLGPFICIWNDWADRYGPMLLGRIAATQSGTRISGRAGSNLQGVILFLILLPIMGVLILRATGVNAGGLAVFGTLLLVGTPAILWMANRDRRQAEPLIRWLQKTLGPVVREAQIVAARKHIVTGARLLVDNVTSDPPLTGKLILDALERVPEGAVVIVEFATECYLQTIYDGDGFLIERRDGNKRAHIADRGERQRPISLAEAYQLFVAYAEQAALPDIVSWRPSN